MEEGGRRGKKRNKKGEEKERIGSKNRDKKGSIGVEK
jgi:hypothetical protein